MLVTGVENMLMTIFSWSFCHPKIKLPKMAYADVRRNMPPRAKLYAILSAYICKLNYALL